MRATKNPLPKETTLAMLDKGGPNKGWTLKEVKTNGMSIGARNPKADMLHASRSVRAIIGKQSEKNT